MFISGPSNETFSCIKGGQVVSVLDATDTVGAKGNQNISPAQIFFFRTIGIETQIITRVCFKRKGRMERFRKHCIPITRGRPLQALEDEKGSSHLRTSLFSDVPQGMFVNSHRRFGTANRTHLQGSTVYKNVG